MQDETPTELETLRREVALIRRVVDTVPAMLAYWDASQRCRFANRAYETWFGVDPARLVGLTLVELLGPIYALNLPYITGALSGQAQQFEREIPNPGGGPPRYAQASYLPDIDEGGVVRGFFVLVSDISQRRLVEDELRLARKTAEGALAQVKILKGLLPVCAWCRKIRDPAGYWGEIDKFLNDNTDATVTHGICDQCAAKHFADG